MNIFICHYGAVRAFSLGFLEEVLKMFQCGETNILQKNPSSKLITEWIRNSIELLFQPTMLKELLAI